VPVSTFLHRWRRETGLPGAHVDLARNGCGDEVYWTTLPRMENAVRTRAAHHLRPALYCPKNLDHLAFMPEAISIRLRNYITSQQLTGEHPLFPICYSTARSFIKKLGEKANVRIRPHDLRRHSATYASRNGVPLKVISKVILRHSDLKTTQMYLGKITDAEAIRWVDVLHSK
jgi:integrase